MDAPHDSEEADSQLCVQLECFADRLNLVFSVFFCHFEFENLGENLNNRNLDRSWVQRTTYNACLHTSLVALRDLDDFFKPRDKRTRKDDLRASDFGCPCVRSFLTDTEREAINKGIAHITTFGAGNPNARWDVWELTVKAVSQATAFLKWVETQSLSSNFYLYTAALNCRGTSNKILSSINFSMTSEDEVKTK